MTHLAPLPARPVGVRTEAALAAVAGIVLACLLRRPVLSSLTTGVPEDLGDPLLQAWQLAWGREALLHQPLSPFDANAFWPLPNSLAFSDSLLGYAPLGVLFGEGPGAALLRYNVCFLLSYALAFTGAYALVRQLGASRTAGAVGGLAFAYAPWHLAQEGHLQILSSGAIPLSLALLARGHGYGRPGPVRPALVLAGWAVAAWQVTLGFGLGLQFGYLLGAVSAVYGVTWLLRRDSPPPRRLLAAEAGGMALFLLVAGLFALPYLTVADDHPEARRSVADLELFSPPLQGFVTAPADSLLYGEAHEEQRADLAFPPEMTLAVGGALVSLALVGVLAGRWPLRRRLGLAAAAAVLLVLAMGTQFAGGGRWTYLLLFEHAPGWEGIRTPGRLVVPLTLALSLLAATGLDRLRTEIGGRLAHVVGLLAFAVVGAETLGTTPVLQAPPLPAALDRATGPVLVLPSDAFSDIRAMYFSTAGLYPLVNGYSGFTPTRLTALRGSVARFPDPTSVLLLRASGVRQVVLLPAYSSGSPWEGAQDRPVEGLPLTRRDVGDAIVYELDPLPPGAAR